MRETTTTLSREGRILIPAGMRRALGLKSGDALTLTAEKGVLRVARREDQLRLMQKRLAHLRDPKHPAVDDLLRERRKAAQAE